MASIDQAFMIKPGVRLFHITQSRKDQPSMKSAKQVDNFGPN